MLEGRTILASLDHLHGEDAAHKTYVQWLAYAPIWPVGARDFLVVTSEEYFDVVNKEGFIIASTSVDDICEEEEIFENKREMEDGKCERKLHTDIYTRSCLRLAGYVGSPNGKGGTDLRIFVDVDMVSYIPSWLLQVLAQYGLSEMMNRIRIATSPEVLAQSADSSELFTAPYKLEKVISQIQQREEKRLQKIGDIGGSSSVAATAMKPFPVKEISSDRKISIDGLSGETADVVSLTTADEPELKLQDPIKILSKKLSCESIPLLKIYIGIETSPDYTFEWTHKLSKNGITIHTSPGIVLKTF